MSATACSKDSKVLSITLHSLLLPQFERQMHESDAQAACMARPGAVSSGFYYRHRVALFAPVLFDKRTNVCFSHKKSLAIRFGRRQEKLAGCVRLPHMRLKSSRSRADLTTSDRYRKPIEYADHSSPEGPQNHSRQHRQDQGQAQGSR
ncbi:hypothetical protein [Herbaspirillum sp.]|uniref:hypothetical protein n=1 Tax=Herbaspirillum sp. TaxID=1890675 RepID=UPI001B2D3662|nr:hypothetical protein [Herbaspirillum sp.]MBO9536637.1 hypothetical protein [Herbaspirillum sp.]